MEKEEQEKNSPKARFDAYQHRDDKKFCKFHPQIHPDNVEKIRLKGGMVFGYKKGDVVSREKFEYCPKCFITNLLT